jgi:hypothetical protein
MERMIERGCGLDVHKKTVVECVRRKSAIAPAVVRVSTWSDRVKPTRWSGQSTARPRTRPAQRTASPREPSAGRRVSRPGKTARPGLG